MLQKHAGVSCSAGEQYLSVKSLAGATLQCWHFGLEQGVAFKNIRPSNSSEMLRFGMMSGLMSWLCC